MWSSDVTDAPILFTWFFDRTPPPAHARWRHSLGQGCQVFTTKPAQLLLKNSPKDPFHKTPGHQQRKSSNVYLYLFYYLFFLNACTCITLYFVLYHLCIRGVPPVKTRSVGYKIHVFGEVTLVKFALQGDKYNVIGVASTRSNSVKVPQFRGKTADLATQLSTPPSRLLFLYLTLLESRPELRRRREVGNKSAFDITKDALETIQSRKF